jgi:hypothetical protein
MIENVCTHLLVMQQGQLQYFGAAEEMRDQYADANSLEEAYFAATHGSHCAPDLSEGVAITPITIPIEAFRSGAEL